MDSGPAERAWKVQERRDAILDKFKCGVQHKIDVVFPIEDGARRKRGGAALSRPIGELNVPLAPHPEPVKKKKSLAAIAETQSDESAQHRLEILHQKAMWLFEKLMRGEGGAGVTQHSPRFLTPSARVKAEEMLLEMLDCALETGKGTAFLGSEGLLYLFTTLISLEAYRRDNKYNNNEEYEDGYYVRDDVAAVAMSPSCIFKYLVTNFSRDVVQVEDPFSSGDACLSTKKVSYTLPNVSASWLEEQHYESVKKTVGNISKLLAGDINNQGSGFCSQILQLKGPARAPTRRFPAC